MAGQRRVDAPRVGEVIRADHGGKFRPGVVLEVIDDEVLVIFGSSTLRDHLPHVRVEPRSRGVRAGVLACTTDFTAGDNLRYLSCSEITRYTPARQIFNGPLDDLLEFALAGDEPIN